MNHLLLLAHTNVLGMKRIANYPVTHTHIYTHTQIKNFTTKSWAWEISINNPFLVLIPELILIALVKNSAFVVSASTNPFNFQLYGMTNLVLHVNVVRHPSEPLAMDCSSPFACQACRRLEKQQESCKSQI